MRLDALINRVFKDPNEGIVSDRAFCARLKHGDSHALILGMQIKHADRFRERCFLVRLAESFQLEIIDTQNKARGEIERFSNLPESFIGSIKYWADGASISGTYKGHYSMMPFKDLRKNMYSPEDPLAIRQEEDATIVPAVEQCLLYLKAEANLVMAIQGDLDTTLEQVKKIQRARRETREIYMGSDSEVELAAIR